MKALTTGEYYDEVRERVYTKKRSALFGIITWDETMKVEQMGSRLVLDARASRLPDVVFVNGIEYVAKPL
jgi:hypothetical protein